MAVASLFEDLLDQYKIEQHIAEKRYTNLYQAYDVDDNRLVRVEILRAEYAEDSSFAGRFVNRARALAQVRHPNIAQVLHIGKATGDAPYVAQASIDGSSLSSRLDQLAQRNTPVNPLYALKLIRQLADALLLGERLELFHYDLQPDNILLKNVALPTDDTVVLLDLFIPAERQPRVPANEGEAERLSYLSPEQRAGKETTAAGHIYSLGVMLYRLLAGRMPEGPVTLQDMALGRVFGRATSLERARSGLAPATYQLVDRSLRKEPRRRYADIGAFTAALDNALAAEEVRLRASAGSPPATARRPLAWLVPLLILALLLAVGAVATRGLRDRAATPETVPIVGAVGNVTPSPSPTGETNSTAADDTTATIDVIAPVIASATAVPTEAADTPSPTSEPSHTPTLQPSATPVPTATAEPVPIVRVMLNLVNLRRGPGVVYPLFGSVAGGEELEVLAWNDDEENPWFLVLTQDQRIGWIAATVVQPENDLALAVVPVAATLPPTPVPSSTSTPTPTNTTVVVTIIGATVDPDDLTGTEPPDSPTDEPTEPPDEPTKTPPPFTPESH